MELTAGEVRWCVICEHEMPHDRPAGGSEPEVTCVGCGLALLVDPMLLQAA